MDLMDFFYRISEGTNVLCHRCIWQYRGTQYPSCEGDSATRQLAIGKAVATFSCT